MSIDVVFFLETLDKSVSFFETIFLGISEFEKNATYEKIQENIVDL